MIKTNDTHDENGRKINYEWTGKMQSLCRWHIVGGLSEMLKSCQLLKRSVWVVAILGIGLGWGGVAQGFDVKDRCTTFFSGGYLPCSDARAITYFIYAPTLCFGVPWSPLTKRNCAAVFVGQSIKEEAERVVNNVRVNKYSHELLVDEEGGTYGMDCSLFVAYVLNKVVPEVLEGVPVEGGGVYRPRAGSFFQAICDEVKGWKRIRNVMEARPGDVIVWREKVYDVHSNSGHVMIIAGYPKRVIDDRVEIEVFDATRTPHAKDSRSLNKEEGVGRGVIWVEVDAEGEPLGYYWSDRAKKLKHKEIVIGRCTAHFGEE